MTTAARAARARFVPRRIARPEGPPRGSGSSRAKIALLTLGPALGVVLLWQVLSTAAASPFFPTPARIIVRLQELWFSGPVTTAFTTELFWSDVAPSMGRALSGWILAAIVGIAVGSIAGQWRKAAAFIDPPVNFMRSLPKPALVPIFLIILGGSDWMRLAFIVFGCIWPVLLNTMQGVRSVDTTYRETARAFHIPLWRTFLQVVLPAASPKIVAGMRVSLSLALILMVLSEWMLAQSGLGYFLLNAQRSFKILDLWAAIMLLGVLGFLLNVVFVAIEKRLLRWHRALTLQS